MKLNRLAIFVLLVGIAAEAAAGIDSDAVVGGALGGAAGAAVGSAVGGRDAAIVGGGLGGALGTAIATKNGKEVKVQREVVYVEEEGRHDNGLHRGHHKRKHKRHHEDD